MALADFLAAPPPFDAPPDLLPALLLLAPPDFAAEPFDGAPLADALLVAAPPLFAFDAGEDFAAEPPDLAAVFAPPVAAAPFAAVLPAAPPLILLELLLPSLFAAAPPFAGEDLAAADDDADFPADDFELDAVLVVPPVVFLAVEFSVVFLAGINFFSFLKLKVVGKLRE